MTKAPFQIMRLPNSDTPGTYDFFLKHAETGKLACGEYRQRSPVPPRHMLEHQARLNSAAVLNSLGV